MTLAESNITAQRLPQLQSLLAPVEQFLLCPTPVAWLRMAARPENLHGLLVDHCNCELKAAQTGLLVMRRYALADEDLAKVDNWMEPYIGYVYRDEGDGQFPDKKQRLSIPLRGRADFPFADELISKMVALIKEELMHFEQVAEVLRERQLPYLSMSASRYAKGMMKIVRTWEPAALIDKLIIGAYIEARSCERFARLAPYLDDELGSFYLRLLKSEARHFADYLTLAEAIHAQAPNKVGDFQQRVRAIGEREAQLINTPDANFRFHSGVPA